MRRQTTKEGANLIFGSDITLSIILLWNLKSLLHAIDQIIRLLFVRWISQLGVSLLPLLIIMQSLRNIEGI